MTDPTGKLAHRCTGLVCHIGSITGQGCSGNRRCPLEELADRGIVTLPMQAAEPAPLALIQGGGDVVAALEDTLERAKSGEVVGVVVVALSEPDGKMFSAWTWAYRDDIAAPWSRLVAGVGSAFNELMQDGI